MLSKAFSFAKNRNLHCTLARYLLTAFALTLIAGTANAEVKKWVDENGQIHFGDRAPIKHEGEVEVVELKEAPKLGLSEQEIADQQRRIADYKRQLELDRSTNTGDSQNRGKTQPPAQSNTHSTRPAMSREECRNKHPSKTADRVRCFKHVDSLSNEL